MLDQSAETIYHMRALDNIHRVVSKFRGLTGEAINTGLTTNERLLLAWLRDIGMLGGLRG